MSDEYNAIMGLKEELKRIADALEKLVEGISLKDVSKVYDLGGANPPSSIKEDDGLTVVQEVQTGEKEEVIQDLKSVFIVGETPKSWVVTKNGHQKYVPFSKIMSPKYEEMEVGNIYDIVLDEGTEKWFHTKPWEKYTPYKAKKGG